MSICQVYNLSFCLVKNLWNRIKLRNHFCGSSLSFINSENNRVFCFVLLFYCCQLWRDSDCSFIDWNINIIWKEKSQKLRWDSFLLRVLFESSFKFIAKYRNFSYSLPHTYIAFISSSISYQAKHVTIDEPTLKHHNHPNSVDYLIGLIFGVVYSAGLDKNITVGTFHLF